MIPCKFSLYLGRENEKGYSDFIAEDNFYCIVEIEEGFTKDQGKALIADLKERAKKSIENLYAFEFFIMDAIKHANVPAHFSLAAVYRKEDLVYLKTAGAGQMFLNREGDFARIIEGDNSASGHLRKDDFFILTTSRFTHLVGSEKNFKQIFSADTLEKNIEELNAKLEGQESQGTIALFLLFNDRPIQATTSVEESEEKTSAPSTPKSSIFDKVRSLQDKVKNSPIRRIITMILVGIILLILIWSVVLGIIRRNNSELQSKILSSQEIIDHKLTKASEVSTLNLPMAIALVVQAREELTSLKKTVGDKNSKEISELEHKIKVEEQKITKKEEKDYEEFFDLTVDSQGAQGDRIFLEGEDALILDKKKGTIYVLSMLQKSLTSRTASGIKQATLVSKNEDTVYVFIPNSGIHSIDADSKTQKVIDQDKEWGSIIDMKMYGGNIYLLDSAKSDVYKYTAAESGFGSKASYFQGVPVNLKESNSLAIDSSVYIGFSDGSLKFTSGVAYTFKTSFPEEGVNIDKVFTSENLDQVYAWDKSKGALYILSKNGTYERQIKSGIFSQGKDIIIQGEAAYVLVGSKIYSISVK